MLDPQLFKRRAAHLMEYLDTVALAMPIKEFCQYLPVEATTALDCLMYYYKGNTDMLTAQWAGQDGIPRLHLIGLNERCQNLVMTCLRHECRQKADRLADTAQLPYGPERHKFLMSERKKFAIDHID